jgi:hypothetical protein
VDEDVIASTYAGWLAAPKGLGGTDYGIYSGPLTSAGGADWHDVDKLTALALKTSDQRMIEAALGNAELSGLLQGFFREADAGRPFDDAGTVDARGRIVSMHARPTQGLKQINYGAIEADLWNRGSVSDGRMLGPTHAPTLGLMGFIDEDPFHAQLAMSEAATFIMIRPGNSIYGDGRGYLPAGVPGDTRPSFAAEGEGRGEGRGLLPILVASQLAPEGSPEQAYLVECIQRGIAGLNGKLNLANPYPQYQDAWDYSKSTHAPGSGAMPDMTTYPLGSYKPYRYGLPAYAQEYGNSVRSADALWGWSLIANAFGYARMYGFDVDSLQQRLAGTYFGILYSSKPLQIGAYTIPTTVLGGAGEQWVQTIEEAMGLYPSGALVTVPQNGIHAYYDMSRSAIAWMYPYTAAGRTGAEAWAKVVALQDRTNLRRDGAKWAIKPLELIGD